MRSLLPLEPAPVLLSDYPIIPCRSPLSLEINGYEISSHVFPAAYPRCPSSPLTPSFPPEFPNNTKEWAEVTVKELAWKKEAQEQGRDTRPPNRQVLWTVANRVVKVGEQQMNGSSARPKLTLIFLHGIGAHKEVGHFSSLYRCARLSILRRPGSAPYVAC